MKFTFPPESKPLAGYTLKRGIHRGGFGEVYYALSDAGKEVALKLLQDNSDIELRGVSHCLNLKHPNLVTIFDVKTDADGDHWVIMEYMSGSSLEDVLDAFPSGMNLAEVQAWLSGIAAGVGFLHDRGLVHRDLKPANIYRENGVAKIGDVGLSKFISQSRRDGQTQSIGTVYYMAPEVAHGRYGREVDIYSVGVILYEMLTGRVPFEGETAGEILMKHLAEKPDLSRIPAPLRPVLAKALEKDPHERTQSIDQLERDFIRAAGGEISPETIPNEAFLDTHRNGHRNAYTHPPRANAGRPAAHQAAGAVATQQRQRADVALLLKLGAAVIVLLAFVAPGIIPMLMRTLFAAGIYGALGYAVFRLVKLGLAAAGITAAASAVTTPQAPVAAPAVTMPPPIPSVTAPPPPPVVHRSVEQRRAAPKKFTVDTVRMIPARRRFAELSASMTFAVFATAMIIGGLSLVAHVAPGPTMGTLRGATGQLDAGRIGLFGLTTLLGAWAVLIPTKFWEGTGTHASTRRLTLLLAGAAVGGAGYWLDRVLMVDVPTEAYVSNSVFAQVGSHPLVMQVSSSENWSGLTAGRPSLLGYVVFFAGLMALRRWWRHADEFRTKRFRISSLLLTVGLAYLLSVVWAFPQVWAMIWAAAISGVVQLSAAWIPPAERPALVEVRP